MRSEVIIHAEAYLVCYVGYSGRNTAAGRCTLFDAVRERLYSLLLNSFMQLHAQQDSAVWGFREFWEKQNGTDQHN